MRASCIFGIAALGLGACGGPTPPAVATGPVVVDMTPNAGLWGTEVTITGSGFGAVAGVKGTVAFEGAIGTSGFLIDTWHDDKVQGRIIFPATGAMTMHAPGGDADIGTFTTAMPWKPSAAADVSQLVDASVLASGDVVAIYHRYQLSNTAALAVFTGANAGAYAIDGLTDPADASAPLHARVVEADDHTPLAIATARDGMVKAITISGTRATTAATGLTGSVLAAGHDTTGVYAWIATSSGLVRARPGTTWTVDRGPIATPHHAFDGAIAADGTLWVVVDEPGSANDSYVALQKLAPGDTQLGAVEHTDSTSYPGTIASAQLVLAADGLHAVVLATADQGGTMTELPPRLRMAAATWGDAPAMSGLVQYAFVGSTLAGIVNDTNTKTTSLVADLSQPANAEVIPVWPALSTGLVVGAAGAVYPLVASGEVTYSLAKQ